MRGTSGVDSRTEDRLREIIAKTRTIQLASRCMFMANEKIARRLTNLKAALAEGAVNTKAAHNAKRLLSRLAYDYPDEASASGVATDHSITLVYQYGVLISDCSVRSENMASPDPTNPLTIMRLRIAYYNALVTAAKPLLEQRRLLLSGPKQTVLNTINQQISDKYAQLRRINQQSRKRAKNHEVDELLVSIADLKKSRGSLFESARSELYENIKQKKAELADIEQRLFRQEMKKLRQVFGSKGKGLWHGNYVTVESEFRNAWRKVSRSPIFTLHYRYERPDGSPPVDPVSWTGWDGEGAITVTHSTNVSPQDLTSICSGGHRYLQIAKLDSSTWEAIGGDPRYMERDISRLYVCKLRIGSERKEPIWTRAVFVMHRPLPADAKIVQATLERKRVGFKHLEKLSICITRKAREHRSSGRRVTVSLGQFPEVATWSDDAGAQGSLCLPSDFLQDMRKLPVLQSLLANYENAIVAQIDELGDQCRPAFEQELQLHTRTRNGLNRYYECWSRRIKVGAEQFRHWKKQVRLQLEQYKSGDKEVIIKAVREAVWLIAPSIQRELGLEMARAIFFACLLVFEERYNHLNLMSAAIREHKLRQRKDIYRKFAHQFRDAMTFVLPKDSLRNRRSSEASILSSPSEFLQVLEQFAYREGIRVEWKRSKNGCDPDPSTHIEAPSRQDGYSNVVIAK